MKTAILSDIHSNLPALDAVLDDAHKQGISTYWCLGDVVGYGPWPVQCWQRLQSLNIAPNAWVAGNHDLGLINKLNTMYFDGAAHTIIKHHRQICKASQHPILKQIQHLKIISQPKTSIILAHGLANPTDKIATVTTYTKKTFHANRAMRNLSQNNIKACLLIVGHTHKSFFWRRSNTSPTQHYTWQTESTSTPQPLGSLNQHPVCLNPGSVGQPRDEDRAASYCYIDWHTQTVTFRRVPYPIEITRNKMISLNYPPSLIKQYYSGSCYKNSTPQEL